MPPDRRRPPDSWVGTPALRVVVSAVHAVTMHDGSRVLLRKVGADYDPTARTAAFEYLSRRQAAGEIVTGLLFIDESKPDMHEVMGLAAGPLANVPYERLNPGQKVLDSIQARFR